MTDPRPIGRFAHLPRFAFRASLLLVPPVLLAALLIAHLHHRNAELSAPLSSTQTFEPEWQQLLAQPVATANRPVYPYSIVPGGVRDAVELRSAVSSDPVVAQHYSDFRIKSARAIRLDHPLAMFVSYRRNDRVFWTRNKMIIPAGETVISDGKNLARTRCGNRLSPVAVKPVAASEPAIEELNEPAFEPPLLAGLLPGGEIGSFSGPPPVTSGPGGPPSANGPSDGGSGGPSTPPVLPPILLPGGPPISPNTPVPPPVNTPEPGSMVLLLVGALAVALLASLFRRR